MVADWLKNIFLLLLDVVVDNTTIFPKEHIDAQG